MKNLLLIIFLLGSASMFAQDPASKNGNLPLTITLFSESVSLPNFRNIFKNPNLGIRIGTNSTIPKMKAGN